jgi:hypothetical protein
MAGRVLKVLVGATGKPPKIYTVPLPGEPGAPDTLLVYRLAPTRGTRTRWMYEYDPSGDPSRRVRWPWHRAPKRPEDRRDQPRRA